MAHSKAHDHFDYSRAKSGFPSLRIANLNGAFCWHTLEIRKCLVEGYTLVFSLQTPRIFAFVERACFKDYRITLKVKGEFACGRVIYESDDLRSMRSILRSIQPHSMVAPIELEALNNGDAVSVWTQTGWHYAIFASELQEGIMRRTFIHFQPATGSGTKSRVIENDASIYLDEEPRRKDSLRRHTFIQQPFSPEEVVGRARSCVGKTDYHIVFNNCETFVLSVAQNITQSTQSAHYWEKGVAGLQLAGAILIAAVVVFVIIRQAPAGPLAQSIGHHGAIVSGALTGGAVVVTAGALMSQPDTKEPNI